MLALVLGEDSVAVPIASAVVFLLFSARIKRQFARPARPVIAAARTTFILLIPAHNEERLLPKLLASTRRLSYPAARFRTVVVADNCTDQTALIARRAGAVCLEFIPPILPCVPAAGTLHDLKAALLKSRPSHHDPPWLGTARIAG